MHQAASQMLLEETFWRQLSQQIWGHVGLSTLKDHPQGSFIPHIPSSDLKSFPMLDSKQKPFKSQC